MLRLSLPLLVALLLALPLRAAEPPPTWAKAADRPAPTADETRAFMKKLARYAFDNHLKRDAKSAQRGMVYEYFAVARKGQFDQWVQGEALDTMHDGAWLAVGLANTYRATGDPFYKDFLTRWQLPFYVKVLNHSDTLFPTKPDDAGPKAHRFDKEHQLLDGEKGFCPYWWDDGASVSLERRRTKDPKPVFSATDNLAGKDNPHFLLDGYSHGCSNHMAQDLALMLQQGWLLLRHDNEAEDVALAKAVAEAAKNLHESRMRHHGPIPAVVAAAALTNADAALMRKVPEMRLAVPSNHYTRALGDLDGKQRQATPGFADDAEYQYYSGIARAGGKLPKPLAFRLVYDAYTEPMLFRYWSDDAPVPPGINRFDLSPVYFRGGKPESYRSDRKVGLGSRMGPQNMVVCAWGLQALRAYPGLWSDAVRELFPRDLRVGFLDAGKGYTIDGKPEPADSEPFNLSGVTLWLVSDRDALIVYGLFRSDKWVLRLHSQPDGKGHHAEVTVTRDGKVTAVNDAGETLKVTGRVLAEKDGPARFELALPYTVVKGQKPWANGIELGRYSASAGDAVRNFVLASSEERVRKALLRELAGGLRTWEAIFAEKGFIPTGIGAGKDWDGFSDSGGYAHLISAAAEYLLYLQEKRDWEVQFGK